MLDWANQPMPFKVYSTVPPIPLRTSFNPDGGLNLEALAGVCYFSNGITRILRGMPFRAAACTGALYHIELYLICGDLQGLGAGVYHYGAHDNALRQLRAGDFRQVIVGATGAEPTVVEAPVIMALTSTWWRNAWKYQARAYRHAFWDSGTILASTLSVADEHALPARLVVGFADDDVNALLDVDPRHEGTVALLSLGGGAPPAPDAPEVRPLNLPTERLSHHEVDYPDIVEAHAASSLHSGADAARWRAQFSAVSSRRIDYGTSVESVILKRGSSRKFSEDPVSSEDLHRMLELATTPISTDAWVATDPYVIVNAADGLRSGTYFYNRGSNALELLRAGDFRREAAHLDLGQELAGAAAADVYWLVDLNRLDDRGYRAAQLLAAIEGGRLYLAAYALGLGATGLTFFDDDVTNFFSPHASGKSVMFLTAVGHPYRRPS